MLLALFPNESGPCHFLVALFCAERAADLTTCLLRVENRLLTGSCLAVFSSTGVAFSLVLSWLVMPDWMP